jgi:hypothetical protein
MSLKKRKNLFTVETPTVKPKGETVELPRHGVKQLFKDSEKAQLNLFTPEQIEETVKELASSIGTTLQNTIYTPGVSLTSSELKVWQGIYTAFKRTNYEGDKQKDIHKGGGGQDGISVKEIHRQRDTVYKNISFLPVIVLTQSELLEVSGFNRTHGDKVDCLEALRSLSEKQYFFKWNRLAKDEKGIPQREKSGQYKMEPISTVETFFKVYTVEDEEGKVKYYEISPSAVLLDQFRPQYGGEFFLIVPKDWMEDIKRLGLKKNKYAPIFLLFLRDQFETIRSNNRKKLSQGAKQRTYSFSKTWEEIAETLKMPESLYKKNRKKAKDLITACQKIALELNHLKKIDFAGVDSSSTADIYYLNEEFFPQPGEE